MLCASISTPSSLFRRAVGRQGQHGEKVNFAPVVVTSLCCGQVLLCAVFIIILLLFLSLSRAPAQAYYDKEADAVNIETHGNGGVDNAGAETKD